MEKITQEKLKFNEITDDLPIEEVVVTMEGGPYQEYFYIELPVVIDARVTKYRRFVFVRDESNYQSFPMQVYC